MRWRALLFVSLVGSSAFALDKQGSAHGGSVGGETQGVGISGAIMFGVALYNPTYAARPDNTGLTLFRYSAHADIDLIGRHLSIPVDLNVFSDRERPSLLVFAPTEGDVISGLTSTWEAARGAIDGGLRLEHDRPLDRLGFTQTYADLRVRYLYSLAAFFPKLPSYILDGDITGWIGQGTFLVNPSYAARPDNSGLALFRYMAHVELSLYEGDLRFGVDTMYFTDRQRSHFTPSELDLTLEVIAHKAPFEAHLAYERDMPLDRGGLVQEFVYVLAAYSFDSRKATPAPVEQRHPIVSP